MTRRSPPPPAARPARSRRILFWACFLWQTLRRRRLARLVRLRLGGSAVRAHGLEHLPASGVFTLAANHNGAGHVLDTIAAILAASGCARPDLADRFLLIVGHRPPGRARPAPATRLARWLPRLVYRRWARHALRIPLGNERASVAFLRAWRRQAGRQPCLVFPEGRAGSHLAAIRPGAGRWLAALGVPVLPVGAWQRAGEWQVRVGPPIRWSHRAGLRDAQVGLAIAALLPTDLAPGWEPALAAWRRAHAAPPPAPSLPPGDSILHLTAATSEMRGA